MEINLNTKQPKKHAEVGDVVVSTFGKHYLIVKRGLLGDTRHKYRFVRLEDSLDVNGYENLSSFRVGQSISSSSGEIAEIIPSNKIKIGLVD